MKIAIAQLNPTVGDLTGNAELILDQAHQALAAGARLMLTPELSLCGYPPRDLLLQAGFMEAMDQTLTALAMGLPHGLGVLVGTVAQNPNAEAGAKPMLNSVAWLENGEIQGVYPKRLLPTYDVFDEDRYFAVGKSPNLMVLEGLKIGITICEDLWNDEEFWGQRKYPLNPVSELQALGVDFIVNLSASPFCVGKQHLRESLLGYAARRFSCPMIYVNQVGGNDDLVFDGRSCVVNGQGAVVARSKAFEASLLLCQWNGTTFEAVAPASLAPPPKMALSDKEEIWKALVLGVRDYAQKCGFKQAVLGLSGGIDSALVAAIATEAIGPANVMGVLMPSPYSSEHSVIDAKELALALGIQTRILPIEGIMQAFGQSLAPAFHGTQSGVSEENIQARIRGTLLMALANKFGYLLISTGNKSELSVGYCTLYGDMSGGLAAIADVPKTRVYELCRWLNQTRDRPIIPQSILTKAPSAELAPNQTDQDSLPPYEVLDDILQRLIDRRESSQQIIASGYEPELVYKIVTLVKRAEFKRRQAAPGIKITDRAFGTGWRMPIASAYLF